MNVSQSDRSNLIDPDALHTERAMELLEAALPATVEAAGPAIKARFNNALLNVAVNRILAEEGASTTATILWRIADALSEGAKPTPGNPVDLSSLQG
ncbi:MAG: hypothetical protein AAGE43_14675 [Pseudomonadota bacterium]